MQIISIIVPMYNSQKTIKKCIESVKNQTCSNWELILVNDGSKDDTLLICSNLKENNEKIKIVTQENKGVSEARNQGIKIATGDFIIFVDSDDYIEQNLIEVISENIKEDNNDLLLFGYNIIRKQKKIKKEISNCSFNNKKEILRHIGSINNFFHFAGPVCKVFKRAIIMDNSIKFEKGLSLGEDTCFVLEYVEKINNMKIIEQYLYNVVQEDGSLSRRNNRNIWMNNKYIFERIENLFKSENYTKEKSNLLFRGIKISINTAVLYKWNNEEYKRLLLEIINSKEFHEINKKELILKFDNILYTLIKYRQFFILKLIIKIKNKIKG